MNHPGESKLEPEPLALNEILVRAGGRSFFIALLVSLLYFMARFAYLNLSESELRIGRLFAQAGVAFTVLWVTTFAFFLISSSRIWSDRAFTVTGFLATFLGLAILTVFFAGLAIDIAHWVRWTPEFVKSANAYHEQVIKDYENLKEITEKKIKKVEMEFDVELKRAATEEEKKELLENREAEINSLRLGKNAENRMKISKARLRQDTSLPGVFWYFLTATPDAEPQDSGIGPALLGSLWLGLITLIFAVPVGVGAALYLEEYRTDGWLARIIQININNLAGVPSVVYGILGGFVFVYIFRQLSAQHPDVDPRNLLGGGLTLGLLTLPMVIVASQEAIRAVPSSLREGAYALGATKWQVMWTIVLPLARPGILTGVILALSRAIGEAAPLVLFGAQQYVDRNPSFLEPVTALTKPFTAMPLQIFQYCGEPGVMLEGYEEPIEIWNYNAALASLVLLVLLLGLNAIAIIMRNRAQRMR